ncbi:hypothetical protein [Oceanobacillus arenosus]|uniref:hypothetical protein n=1 Tax=Oceanobacillus arenosus TaxID=1229153 RepID=UPI0014743DD2|nr:hypothetical protein [Oceanobacillus arenosus]
MLQLPQHEEEAAVEAEVYHKTNASSLHERNTSVQNTNDLDNHDHWQLVKALLSEKQ